MAWSVKTGSLLLAQIHGYHLDLKSTNTLIVSENLNLHAMISAILILIYIESRIIFMLYLVSVVHTWQEFFGYTWHK